MRAKGRLRRIAKRLGLILLTAVVACWIVSLFWGLNYEFDKSNVKGAITIADGEIGWMTIRGLNVPSNPKGFSVERVNGNRVWGLELLSIKRDDLYGKDNWLWVTIPLWLPFLMVAAPTTFLWYIDRRREEPGHCAKCGYNLTANTSGICPECGMKFDRGPR